MTFSSISERLPDMSPIIAESEGHNPAGGGDGLAGGDLDRLPIPAALLPLFPAGCPVVTPEGTSTIGALKAGDQPDSWIPLPLGADALLRSLARFHGGAAEVDGVSFLQLSAASWVFAYQSRDRSFPGSRTKLCFRLGRVSYTQALGLLVDAVLTGEPEGEQPHRILKQALARLKMLSTWKKTILEPEELRMLALLEQQRQRGREEALHAALASLCGEQGLDLARFRDYRENIELAVRTLPSPTFTPAR